MLAVDTSCFPAADEPNRLGIPPNIHCLPSRTSWNRHAFMEHCPHSQLRIIRLPSAVRRDANGISDGHDPGDAARIGFRQQQ
jgi:hypothetical protein